MFEAEAPRLAVRAVRPRHHPRIPGKSGGHYAILALLDNDPGTGRTAAQDGATRFGGANPRFAPALRLRRNAVC
jgi:hypothetical protein